MLPILLSGALFALSCGNLVSKCEKDYAKVEKLTAKGEDEKALDLIDKSLANLETETSDEAYSLRCKFFATKGDIFFDDALEENDPEYLRLTAGYLEGVLEGCNSEFSNSELIDLNNSLATTYHRLFELENDSSFMNKSLFYMIQRDRLQEREE